MNNFGRIFADFFVEIGKTFNFNKSKNDTKFKEFEIKGDKEALEDDWKAIGESLKSILKNDKEC